MIFLRLFFEFAKVGLFAVGGGLATIPFLQDMGARTGWFTDVDLTTMIAVSESTPGPMGVNMATYVGFQTGSLAGGPLGGAAGAVLATLGLITPSIIIIIDGRIVEMCELPDHPFFVATQAHPELKSRPNRPHPLFKGFVEAALAQKKQQHD